MGAVPSAFLGVRSINLFSRAVNLALVSLFDLAVVMFVSMLAAPISGAAFVCSCCGIYE